MPSTSCETIIRRVSAHRRRAARAGAGSPEEANVGRHARRGPEALDARKDEIPPHALVSPPRLRRRAALALLLVVPIPGLATWFGLVGAPGPVGRVVFLLAKVWVLAVPALFSSRVERRRLGWPRPVSDGMALALASGAAMAVAILGYYTLLPDRADLLRSVGPVVRSAGLDSPARYLALAVYWTLLNSLYEEYVWRWFVTRHAVTLLGGPRGVLFAALLFTVHHYVALSAFVGPGLTWTACGGVFVAACAWSWLYTASRNVWAPYVSHVFADAAVFAIGYDILFRT